MVASKPRILIIDDEPGTLKVLNAILQKEGYDIDAFLNCSDAFNSLSARCYDLCLVDYRLPGMNGLQFIERTKKRGYKFPIIVITAFGSLKIAVEAMRKGAYNYLTKPLNYDELKILIGQAIEKHRMEIELEKLRYELKRQYSFSNIIGKSHHMQKIFNIITNIADTDATVLISGETGTGKELVARAIHFNSYRKHKEFVVINCSALVETLLESELFGHEQGSFTGAVNKKIGKFEAANGGTFFLDEVSSTSLSLQAKLLRVIEEKEFYRVGGNKKIEVDVRIISSANQNLSQMVKEEKLREDLFFRLNVVSINLPPLRERREDIPLLIQHFLEQFSKKYKRNVKGISDDLMRKFLSYNWPGNVRELENMIERGVLLGRNEELREEDLAGYLERSPDKDFEYMHLSLREAKIKFEHKYISCVLSLCKGRVKEASKIIGLNERNVYEKMKKYGLNKEDFKHL